MAPQFAAAAHGNHAATLFSCSAALLAALLTEHRASKYDQSPDHPSHTPWGTGQESCCQQSHMSIHHLRLMKRDPLSVVSAAVVVTMLWSSKHMLHMQCRRSLGPHRQSAFRTSATACTKTTIWFWRRLKQCPTFRLATTSRWRCAGM